MNLNHDQQSIIVTDEIFKKWKQKESSWKNKFIEDDIQIVVGQLNFPSPDRSFYSSKIKSRIAIEFKPIGNHREDIIKGLGQVVTYLNKNSTVEILGGSNKTTPTRVKCYLKSFLNA